MYFVTSWSASYYLDTFGLRPDEASLHLAMPHVVNITVNVLVSPALNRFLRSRGCGDLTCRRIFTGLGFAVPAGLFRLIPLCTDAYTTTAFFSLTFGFMALHPSGFKANYMDVTTTRGGLVSGIGNTIASIASSIGPPAVAYLRQTAESWQPSFSLVSFLCLAAGVVYCTTSSVTPIESAAGKDD